MRVHAGFALLSSLSLAACGSSSPSDSGESPEPPTTEEENVAVLGFDPPPAPEGYERIVAPVMENLETGADVMYCQYVRGPADRDLDILDVQGYQSIGGHHAVAYATTVSAPIGQSGPCQEEDNLAAGFLGGIGGEAGGAAALPEGVAFRLTKGSSIMLNTHFLNTTGSTIDGESVLDIQFAEVDPNRKIASMFVNGHFTFDIPAGQTLEAVAECEVPQDMEMVMFANHMHDYGSHAMTEIVRAETAAPEVIHEDPEWTYEMQFNAVYRRWDLENPLQIRAGDVFRTHCNWNNDSTESLTFPREMCVGVGFFISDGSTSPVCANGVWFDNMPNGGMP